MPMFGHLKIIHGNNKWLNYNEQVELFVVRNGHQKVKFSLIKKYEMNILISENKFAIGSSDKNVGVCYYEVEQRFWAAEMIKKKPKSTVTCIAWHPNNQLIVAGSCDYRVRIYSAYIKAVDGQPRSSNWGAIGNTGELLQEFQSGIFVL